MNEPIPQLIKTGKRNEALGLKINIHDSRDFSKTAIERFTSPHRRHYYLFLFILEGRPVHMVDMQQVQLSPGKLLFVLPNQLHFQLHAENSRYYKIGFHEQSLALLPRQFQFLLNPLQTALISPGDQAGQRIHVLFDLLLQMVGTAAVSTDLIIPYLNTLMTELEIGYFASEEGKRGNHERLNRFILFKQKVEENLFHPILIADLATELGMTAGGLHKLVRSYTGMAPKDYINRRIILEAQRTLYYSSISVKELAYQLGLNDPDYFSRLFRKISGRTVSEFQQYVKGFSD